MLNPQRILEGKVWERVNLFILVTLVILLALFSSKEFVFALCQKTEVTLRVKIVTTTQTVPGIFDWEEEENEKNPASYPLTYKANLDSLEGKRIIFSHRVKVKEKSALAGGGMEYIYQPYLNIAGKIFWGEEIFEEEASRLGGENVWTVAESLEIIIHESDEEKVYQYPLVEERSGPDEFLCQFLDSHCLLILSNLPEESFVEKALKELPSFSPQLEEVSQPLEKLDLSSEEVVQENASSLGRALEIQKAALEEELYALAVLFSYLADQYTTQLAEEADLIQVPTFPRLIITSGHVRNNKLLLALDIRKDEVKASSLLKEPRGKEDCRRFQLKRGILLSRLEAELLKKVSGREVFDNTYFIFQEMEKQGIPPLALSFQVKEKLTSLEFPSSIRKKVSQVLKRGKIVIVPRKMVRIGEKERIVWWEINPQTWAAVGVTPSGHHQALVEAAYLVWAVPKVGAFVPSNVFNSIITQTIKLWEEACKKLIFVFGTPQDLADLEAAVSRLEAAISMLSSLY